MTTRAEKRRESGVLKSLQSWLDDIPMTSGPMVVGPVLLDRLNELNASELSAPARARATQSMAAALDGVDQQLDSMFVAKPFPLSENQVNAGRLAVRLAGARAKSYRLQATGEGRGGLFRKGMRPMQSLRAATESLRRAMLTHLLLYEPVPIDLWREHHKLYLGALRIAQKRRPHPADLEDTDHIGNGYAQIILLNHASPYRFRHADLLEASNILETWAEHCRIVTDTKWDGKALVLDVGSRDPLNIDPRRASRYAVFLDIASLSTHLQQLIDDAGESAEHIEVETAGGAANVAIELVQTLATSWGLPLTRGHKRLAATHELQVHCGLPAVHQAACDRDFSQLVAAVPASLRQAMSGGANWATDTRRLRTAQPGKARVVDQSVGGYRLRWSSGGGVKARVGELLAVRETEADESKGWNYGVVRWIRASDLGWVQGGVELISRKARGVVLIVRNAEGRDMPPQRALVFAPLRGTDGKVRTIVAPPIKLENAERVRISNPRAPSLGLLEVELIHLQEQTSEFCQWECRLTEAR